MNPKLWFTSSHILIKPYIYTNFYIPIYIYVPYTDYIYVKSFASIISIFNIPVNLDSKYDFEALTVILCCSISIWQQMQVHEYSCKWYAIFFIYIFHFIHPYIEWMYRACKHNFSTYIMTVYIVYQRFSDSLPRVTSLFEQKCSYGWCRGELIFTND